MRILWDSLRRKTILMYKSSDVEGSVGLSLFFAQLL